HALAGVALPNVILQRDAADPARPQTTLHQLLGPWFTALVLADEPPPARASHPLLHWVAAGPHCDDAGRAALARQLRTSADDRSVWLIRPDQHVMTVRAAEDVDALLAQLQHAIDANPIS